MSRFFVFFGFALGSSLSLWGFATPQNVPSWRNDYEQGLRVWRTPGRDTTPCVFCHSPDGIELAAYNFSDADIRRRATPHLEPQDAESVVKLIHAVRAKYKLTKLLDPLKDRPLQPAGHPLPGASPIERDKAFVFQLKKDHPALFTHVKNRDDALRFHRAVRNVDIFTTPIGIEFNRLSEDRFRGRDHATVAHWFSDTEFRPVISWDILFTVHDQYLQNPNDKAIGAMQDFAPQRLMELSTPADQMATFKYNSLNLFQHVLRQRATGIAPFGSNKENILEAIGRDYVPNPAWNLGELTSEYADLDLKSFHFPDQVVAAKSGSLDSDAQLKQMRTAWLYMGWMFDQGFLRRDVLKPVGEVDVKRTALITSTLLTDGPFPVHAALVVARKTAIRVGEGHTDLELGALADVNPQNIKFRDPAHELDFVRLLANAAKSCVLVSKANSPKANALMKWAQTIDP